MPKTKLDARYIQVEPTGKADRHAFALLKHRGIEPSALKVKAEREAYEKFLKETAENQ